MPYRRRRRAIRRRRPTRGLTKHQKRQVKRILAGRQELKAVDTNIDATSVSSSGTIRQVTMPTVGDSVSQRDGDQINVKTLRMRLNMLAADATNTIRVIVFRWSQDNSLATPLLGDVLQTASPMAMYNYTSDRDGKLKILYDRTLSFTDGGTMTRMYRATFYGKRLGKKRITFAAGTVLGPDQIYALMISDSVAVSHPTVYGHFRLEYTDS